MIGFKIINIDGKPTKILTTLVCEICGTSNDILSYCTNNEILILCNRCKTDIQSIHIKEINANRKPYKPYKPHTPVYVIGKFWDIIVITAGVVEFLLVICYMKYLVK